MAGMVSGGRSHRSDQRHPRRTRRLEGARQLVRRGAGPGRVLDVCVRNVRPVALFPDREQLPGRTDYLDQHGDPLVPRGPGLDIQMAGDRIATVARRRHAVRPVCAREDSRAVVSSRPLLGWSTEIATTVGFLSELVRLRLETAQALHEAEASRRRLVAAHDEERHRLERDLHDGAQQRLVALGMRLRRVQRRLPEQDGALAEVFDGSVAELQAAVCRRAGPRRWPGRCCGAARVGPRRVAGSGAGCRRRALSGQPGRPGHAGGGGAAVRIVIAEDAALFRQGLTLQLQDGGAPGRRDGPGRRVRAASGLCAAPRSGDPRRTDAAPPR